MKITTEANELTDVDPTHISLVNRGANRVPFRYTKGEGDLMGIDLSKILKIDRKPVISALVIAEEFDSDRLRKSLEEKKFKFDKKAEQDSALIFAQGNQELEKCLENATLVKTEEEGVFLAVKNISKAFSSYTWTSTTFQELLNQEGFYPQVSTAMSVVYDGVYNILDQAGDGATAADQIRNLFKDAGEYIAGLAENIPADAFFLMKAETPKPNGGQSSQGNNPGSSGEDNMSKESVQKADQQGSASAATTSLSGVSGSKVADSLKPEVQQKTEEKPAEGDGKTGTQEPGTSGDKEPKPGGVINDGEAKPTVGASGTDNPNPDNPNPEGQSAQTQVQPQGEPVLEAVQKAMESAMAPILEAMAKTTESITSVQSRLDGMEERITKAEEATGSIIRTDTGGERQKPVTKTQKSEDQEEGFVHIDTGFSRPRLAN